MRLNEVKIREKKKKIKNLTEVVQREKSGKNLTEKEK
jgi:hypothetical protein